MYQIKHITTAWLLLVALMLSSTVQAAPASQDETPDTPAQQAFDEGNRLLESQMYEESIPQLAIALELYRANGDRFGEAYTLNAIGHAQTQLRQFQAALDTFATSLPLWQELGDRHRQSVAYSNMGLIYKEMEEYERALDVLQNALALAESGENQAQYGRVLMLLGDVHFEQEDFDAALAFYGQAVDPLVEGGDRVAYMLLLRNLGLAARAVKQYDRTMEAFLVLATLLASDQEYDTALSYTVFVADLARSIGEQEVQASALRLTGQVYTALKDWDAAHTSYTSAVFLVAQMDDPLAQRQFLSDAGDMSMTFEKYEFARDYYLKALSIAPETDDPNADAQLFNELATAHRELGERSEALAAYQKALDRVTLVDNPGLEWQILTSYAVSHIHLFNQYSLAYPYQERALAIARDHATPTGLGFTLENLALIELNVGELQKGLDHMLEAVRLARVSEDKQNLHERLHKLSFVYFNLGRLNDALASVQEAIEIREALGDSQSVAAALTTLAGIYSSADDPESALDAAQRALTIVEEAPEIDNSVLTSALGIIVDVYEEREEYAEMQPYLEQLEDTVEALGDRSFLGSFRFRQGGLHYAQQEYTQAIQRYEEALTIFRESGVQEVIGVTLAALGELHKELGNTALAEAYLTEAVTVGEAVQSLISVEELRVTHSGSSSYYAPLVQLLVDEERGDEAYAYIERARAQAFLSQIGSGAIDFFQGVDEQINRDFALRQEIAGLQQALQKERSKPLNLQSSEILDELQTRLRQTQSRYEDHLIDLKLAHPEYAAAVTIETLPVDEVQALLDDKTTLIEYFATEDGVMAWVIEQGVEAEAVARPIRLPITWQQLNHTVERLRGMLTCLPPDECRERLQRVQQENSRLYQALIADLKESIHTPNLLIAPHGPLHHIPFAALWDATQSQYLVEQYTITYIPSATSLRFLQDKRSPNDGRLLVMGNPDGSLPRAEAEAVAIAEQYGTTPLIGSAAQEDVLYTSAGQYDIWHLAAHGVYNRAEPLFTRIELTTPDPLTPPDGNLTVADVYGLDLTGVNLVVLSACESERGEVSNGDDIVGLSRAFLYAGAPSVITTLWSIDDQASSELMQRFYIELRAGAGAAQALQIAQQAILRSDEWASPYFWAAFRLTGDSVGE